MRQWWTIFVTLAMPALVTVLALDLIYLYIIGKWYDPIRVVELAEVVILAVLASFGIYQVVRKIKDAKNG